MNPDRYKPMLCPVCEAFYFSELTEDDLELPESEFQCFHCGWIYDLNQIENPELKSGNNEKSLQAYRAWFKGMLDENPDYDWSEAHYSPTPHQCPVCGRHTFEDEDSFDVCPACGWEDDSLMENEPDQWAGCSNDLCLNDFKKRYESFVSRKADYQYRKDGFLK